MRVQALPAHWVPYRLRSWALLRFVLAPDNRHFMSDHQKRIVGLMRLSLWLPSVLLIIAAVTVATAPARRRDA